MKQEGNNIFIVEDMALNRKMLELLLVKEGYNVIGWAANAEKAYVDICNLMPDLVIVDINLEGDKDGIWLANELKNNAIDTKPLFLTAYNDQETIDNIISLGAAGYIMKPYNASTLLVNIKLSLSNTLNKSKYLTIRTGYDTINIEKETIEFLKSEGNYLEIVTSDKTYLVRQKLEDIQKVLPLNLFIRVHQRYLINITKVSSFSSNEILMNQTSIPFSRTFKNDALNLINSYHKVSR